MYSVVPATLEHAAELAPRICEADQREAWLAARLKPAEALYESWTVSREPLAGLIDGRVVCLFGVGGPALSRVGHPWMLASDELFLPAHSHVFLRASIRTVREWRKQYDHLTNYVDAGHKRAVQWLGWLGFELGSPEPFGPFRADFRRFMTRGEQ